MIPLAVLSTIEAVWAAQKFTSTTKTQPSVLSPRRTELFNTDKTKYAPQVRADTVAYGGRDELNLIQTQLQGQIADGNCNLNLNKKAHKKFG